MDAELVSVSATVPAALHAPLSDLLAAAGALALTTQDGADAPLLEPPPGTLPLWPQVRVTAHFPAHMDLAPLRALLALRAIELSAPQPVPQQDWIADTQRVSAHRYGQRLWVAAPGSASAPADAAVVWLTPGVGFGTGTHPTTALCLEWLDAHPPAGLAVLDYGCGSGILALAAARLGAARVQAVDLDAQACRAAAQNAAQNGLDTMVCTGPPHVARGPVDLILANILLPVLVALAPRFAALLVPGGRLVVSGILAEQSAALCAACAPFVRFAPPVSREGWALLEGSRVAD